MTSWGWSGRSDLASHDEQNGGGFPAVFHLRIVNPYYGQFVKRGLKDVTMLDPTTYYLFLATALVLVLTPGPDTVLILSRTIASGAWAGFMTLLGTQTGNVIHAVLAGIGVSTIVLLFPTAFLFLKLIGIAYLLYLAVQAWRTVDKISLKTETMASEKGSRYFLQGLVNNLANPKMVAFFVALFPQFIHPQNGAMALQSLILGLTLAGMAVLWIGFVVAVVGKFRSAVVTQPKFLRFANKLAAATFVGLAVRLALEPNR